MSNKFTSFKNVCDVFYLTSEIKYIIFLQMSNKITEDQIQMAVDLIFQQYDIDKNGYLDSD